MAARATRPAPGSGPPWMAAGRGAPVGTPRPPAYPGRVPKPVAHVVPTIPASAGALVFDRRGRLLVLDPTYKSGWTLPGGEMEDTGETPWQACRREVREECGLDVAGGRLVCVDTRPARPGRRGGVRFLFDCGR